MGKKEYKQEDLRDHIIRTVSCLTRTEAVKWYNYFASKYTVTRAEFKAIVFETVSRIDPFIEYTISKVKPPIYVSPRVKEKAKGNKDASQQAFDKGIESSSILPSKIIKVESV